MPQIYPSNWLLWVNLTLLILLISICLVNGNTHKSTTNAENNTTHLTWQW